MKLEQLLANLEKKLYEQEHHFLQGLGHLDRTYVKRQARRRELTQAWMDEMTARIRELERERAALRKRVGKAEGVVLTAEGFREKPPD